MRISFNRIVASICTGAVIGQFIGFWISVVFSALNGAAQWIPSTPGFVARFGQFPAVVLSACIWSAIGVMFSLTAELVYNHEPWGIWQKMGVYYVVTLLLFTPLASVAGWFPLNPLNFLGFAIIFTVLFAIIGAINMLMARRKVDDLNQHLNRNR
ncbi:MAG: DUF3021 domain-containing protein [Bifidobacterium crudilactis]|uniref:DUF3021 domain-containing protein n=1 Tax=Bifidobacterium crudilactis TaxID=327277 RepID=UPI002646FF77|nr:DUF3021 domain-containing protein [Bifidobacterium crudilactis]MDN6586024.1 DUF3021 domain-containing protein [Bifidobacterium crudilactis]